MRRTFIAATLAAAMVTSCSEEHPIRQPSHTPVFPSPNTSPGHTWTGGPVVHILIKTRKGMAPTCDFPAPIHQGDMLAIDVTGDGALTWTITGLDSWPGSKDPQNQLAGENILADKRGHFTITTLPPTSNPCDFTVR